MVTDGQFYWPSVGIFVAAYGQFFMAANSRILHNSDVKPDDVFSAISPLTGNTNPSSDQGTDLSVIAYSPPTGKTVTAVNNEIPGTHRHPAVAPSGPSEVTRKLGALGAHLSAATAATVTLAVVLSGCASYGPLGKDDLKTSWTAIGGSADREVSGPDGILHEIKDNTVYAPSTCSILAGPDVASPYALDDLGSSDPGFSGNFNSPSRPSPSPGSISPPGLSDYLGGTRLFATEQKATDYFNAVAGALNTCHSVETTYKGSASWVTWVKGPYATQGTITWSVGKVTGLLIRKGNIVLVAHSVSSNVPDIAVDAAKLSQAMGAS